MPERRFVASSRKLSMPCYKCGKNFNPGDRVVARSRRQKTGERGVRKGLNVHHYHEDCWEKLFL